MTDKKETTHKPEACGRLYGNDISKKKRRSDIWYPRMMTILLALNLLLQILLLVLRW